MLDEIFEKCKSHGDKRGLRYINRIETPTSRDIVFVKGKDETPNQATLFILHTLSYFAHTLRSLDILKIGVTLDFLKSMSLNYIGL